MNRLLILSLLFSVNITSAQVNDFPRSRPDDKGVPTKVFVSFYVIDIERIDSKEQSFTLDIVIRLKWNDPRITEVNGPIPLSTIWQPNVQIYNLRNVDNRLPEEVRVLEDGMVQYTQRYYATLTSHLDFKDFPFDVQLLPVSLLSFGFTPEEVDLVFESAGGEKKFSISNWSIERIGAKESDYAANLFDDSSEEIIRPRMDYEFKATRYLDFYRWKVLAPLMVILFLSWAVFWIDPSQVGAQIGVSGTSILALIAFLFKLDNDLPPVSYLTHMDHFIFTTLVLVFVSYLEALVSTTYAVKGNKKFADRLDYTFRIGYPIVFLIVFIIFWV